MGSSYLILVAYGAPGDGIVAGLFEDVDGGQVRNCGIEGDLRLVKKGFVARGRRERPEAGCYNALSMRCT